MTAPLPGLGQVTLNSRQTVRSVIENPDRLDELTMGLEAEQSRFKYGCAKALRMLSEAHPDLLYPRFDFFLRQLDHQNKILQWEAARVLSQLARVDTERKLEAAFAKYFSPIPGPVMITAAHVIKGGARIARAKPDLADRIASEILKVAQARYQTPECRNVAVGHAIAALGNFFDLLNHPEPVLRFVRKQTRNSHPATRKKAQQFLGQVGSLPAKRKVQSRSVRQ